MGKFRGGQRVSLTVERYGSQGEGVGQLPDGMTCFVRGGLAGETCLVSLDKVGKSAARGHVVDITNPSPARMVPDCPYYFRCGGCGLRHMSYEEELRFKRQKVQDALTRIGGTKTVVSAIYGADNTICYRNKVQFPVGKGGEIGFYEARSHRVVDVEDCLLQPPTAGRLRSALKEFMSTYGVSAYDEQTGKGLVRHLYLRTNRAGASLCCILVNGTALPHEEALVAVLREAEPNLAGVVLGINEKKSNVILGDRYRTLWGEDSLPDELCGLTFRLSVPSFYQVNREQTEVLYGLVMEFAQLSGGETVLDLYCGIGTITLCLAKKAGMVYGAEVVPQAVEDARENALRNGISNAEFFCGDAADVAADFAARGVRPQVITVDPPRKGLAETVVADIVKMEPERVVYVSCDPATLGRDIKRFGAYGYHAVRAVAVDLFPRTEHVECCVLLCREEK